MLIAVINAVNNILFRVKLPIMITIILFIKNVQGGKI